MIVTKSSKKIRKIKMIIAVISKCMVVGVKFIEANE